MQEILRRASAADAPALNALMHASRAYDGAYRAMLDGCAVTIDQIARDHVVLAEDGRRVLGFYSLIVDSAPELDLMFVADAAQGRDLGRRLFDHMRHEARTRGFDSVRIVCHPPALGFYLRMGAVQVGATEPVGAVTWSRPILTLSP